MNKPFLPWLKMASPLSINSIKKRRVDSNLNNNFWWTKAYSGQFGLQIEFAGKVNHASVVNEFDQFKVVFDERKNWFSIELTAEASKTVEVFYGLCLDLISFIENSFYNDDESLLSSIFVRVKQWQNLFKQKTTSFTDSQQIGLLGELSLINDTLFNKFDYKDILNIWRGPIPEPQDFVSSNWAVEVKSQRASSEPIISINSLNQLDTVNVPIFISHRMFLDSIKPSNLTLNLYKQVELILKKIGRDNFYYQYFLSLLNNLGYDHDAPYAQKPYELKVIEYYQVREDFPRLARSKLPKSIVGGKYSLDLSSLASFKVSNIEFLNGLAP